MARTIWMGTMVVCCFLLMGGSLSGAALTVESLEVPSLQSGMDSEDTAQDHAGCREFEPGRNAAAILGTPTGPCNTMDWIDLPLHYTLLICPEDCVVLAMGITDTEMGMYGVVCHGSGVALVDWKDGDHLFTPNCWHERDGTIKLDSVPWFGFGVGTQGIHYMHSEERETLLLALPTGFL
jgi:hypothetical protein